VITQIGPSELVMNLWHKHESRLV